MVSYVSGHNGTWLVVSRKKTKTNEAEAAPPALAVTRHNQHSGNELNETKTNEAEAAPPASPPPPSRSRGISTLWKRFERGVRCTVKKTRLQIRPKKDAGALNKLEASHLARKKQIWRSFLGGVRDVTVDFTAFSPPKT